MELTKPSELVSQYVSQYVSMSSPLSQHSVNTGVDTNNSVGVDTITL